MLRSRMKQREKTLMAAALFATAIVASPSVLAQSGICVLTGNPPVPATAPCNVPPPNPGLNIPDPGLINPDTWGFGPQNNLTPAQQTAQYWNPVKARIVAGLPFTGKRVSTPGVGTGSAFCNVAQYNVDNNHFTWIDMLHSGLGYSQTWPMMVNTACPGLTFTTRTARALQIPIDERDGQHSSDGGAIIYIFPVDSVADAEEAAFWVYFTPIGHHSTGGSQLGSVYTGNTPSPPPTTSQTGIGITDAGGQRNSVNRNTVLIAQIGSVEGAQQAAGIASHDLVQAIYLDEPDLASKAGASFTTLANGVKAAAKANNKHLCLADRTTTPHTMTCALQP
ncbi:MAG: hypothetical protein ABWY07_00680 [Burkholderiales bacterium]